MTHHAGGLTSGRWPPKPAATLRFRGPAGAAAMVYQGHRRGLAPIAPVIRGTGAE
jgi:hypothetical protein